MKNGKKMSKKELEILENEKLKEKQAQIDSYFTVILSLQSDVENLKSHLELGSLEYFKEHLSLSAQSERMEKTERDLKVLVDDFNYYKSVSNEGNSMLANRLEKTIDSKIEELRLSLGALSREDINSIASEVDSIIDSKVEEKFGVMNVNSKNDEVVSMRLDTIEDSLSKVTSAIQVSMGEMKSLLERVVADNITLSDMIENRLTQMDVVFKKEVGTITSRVGLLEEEVRRCVLSDDDQSNEMLMLQKINNKVDTLIEQAYEQTQNLHTEIRGIKEQVAIVDTMSGDTEKAQEDLDKTLSSLRGDLFSLSKFIDPNNEKIDDGDNKTDKVESIVKKQEEVDDGEMPMLLRSMSDEIEAVTKAVLMGEESEE